MTQPEQEPVAWVDPATLHHLKIGLEGVHLVYETEMVNSLPLYDKPQFQNPKQCLERLIRIMGTFDLATGHADTFDELLDSLESELRDVLGHYRAAVKEYLTQEPVAMLERTPRLGILRVTYEDAVTELHEGLYPLYVKPQIEVGCAECGVNGGYALYCVACAEKFVGGYKDSGVPAVKTGLEQVSPDTPPQENP